MRKSFPRLLCLLSLLAASGPASTATRTADELFAREMFARAISIDTSVTEHRTPELAAYLEGLLLNAGFERKDVIKVQQAPNLTSLIVKYPGRDAEASGIGFMAHMDVVTALKKDWVLDPFSLTEQDGYFIGRGTADNKAGVVGLAATFIKLKKAGYVPSRSMVLILTSDEETGMLAANEFATQRLEDIDIEYAINSDGFSGVLTPDGEVYVYYVQGAEKNYQTFEVTVRNPGGHSSAPRSDNAIYELAHALIKIESFKFPVSINEVTAGMLAFDATKSDARMAKAIRTLLKDQDNVEASDIVSSSPQFATVIRTTCVATMLEGGHAENALAQSATATVNCRVVPGVTPEEVRSALVKVIDDQRVQVMPMQEYATAPASPMRADVMDAIEYALSNRYPDVQLVPYMASYGTDGREFRAVGIPVYGSAGIFMKPEEGFAHGLNEKISVEAFYNSLDYWERLMKKLSR
jgi:carboxypeptidase PM20D1